jgi:hypothetical protein
MSRPNCTARSFYVAGVKVRSAILELPETGDLHVVPGEPDGPDEISVHQLIAERWSGALLVEGSLLLFDPRAAKGRAGREALQSTLVDSPLACLGVDLSTLPRDESGTVVIDDYTSSLIDGLTGVVDGDYSPAQHAQAQERLAQISPATTVAQSSSPAGITVVTSAATTQESRNATIEQLEQVRREASSTDFQTYVSTTALHNTEVTRHSDYTIETLMDLTHQVADPAVVGQLRQAASDIGTTTQRISDHVLHAATEQAAAQEQLALNEAGVIDTLARELDAIDGTQLDPDTLAARRGELLEATTERYTELARLSDAAAQDHRRTITAAAAALEDQCRFARSVLISTGDSWAGRQSLTDTQALDDATDTLGTLARLQYELSAQLDAAVEAERITNNARLARSLDTVRQAITDRLTSTQNE